MVLKRVAAILLCVCLMLCCACSKKPVAPDKEAPINSEIIRPTPQVITDEVDAEKGKEAVLTSEELARAYSYSFLNNTEKRVYRIMLNMVRHLTAGWIDVGLVESEPSATVAKAHRAMSNDFPEYYWMPSSYYITVNGTTVAVSFKRNDVEDCYGYQAYEIEGNRIDFDDAVERALSKVKKAESDFDKEVIIHDFICKTATYDSEFDKYGEGTVYTAYGALVNGRAVCEGYSRAFKLLCQYAGLECILITGDSKGVGHMWNMVKLEGDWYHVDVTWDDLRSKPHHTYLNLTELQIRADHDIDIVYADVPSSNISLGNSYNFCVPNANSDKLNFFVKNGLIIKDDPIDFVASELVKSYKAGESHTEFLFYNSDVADDFKENYADYVVKIQDKCVSLTGRVKFKLKSLSFPSNSCVLYFEEV